MTSPDADIEVFLTRERVNHLMEIVNEREKKVLDMRFGLVDGVQHTLAEVAKKLKISRERVRQIEEAALLKLRRFVSQQEKGTWPKEEN